MWVPTNIEFTIDTRSTEEPIEAARILYGLGETRDILVFSVESASQRLAEEDGESRCPHLTVLSACDYISESTVPLFQLAVYWAELFHSPRIRFVFMRASGTNTDIPPKAIEYHPIKQEDDIQETDVIKFIKFATDYCEEVPKIYFHSCGIKAGLIGDLISGLTTRIPNMTCPITGEQIDPNHIYVMIYADKDGNLAAASTKIRYTLVLGSKANPYRSSISHAVASKLVNENNQLAIEDDMLVITIDRFKIHIKLGD